MDAIDLNTRSAPSPASHAQFCGGACLPSEVAWKALSAAVATLLLLLLCAGEARAQAIGELDVRSRLGERFFGAIPVQAGTALLDPGCIKVLSNPNAPAGAEPLQGARVRIGSADTVIIETLGTVMSPIVGLRLAVGCENPVTRDFVVLGEGVTLAATPATPADSAPRAAPAAEPTISPPPAASRGVGAATGAESSGAAPRQAARRAAAPARSPAVPSPVAQPAPAVGASPEPEPATRAATAAAARADVTAASATAAGDANDRVAELRARSDDQTAALLALDDRLALLQKRAELLKAQFEQVLASVPPAQSSVAAGAAPAVSTVAAAVPPPGAATQPPPAAKATLETKPAARSGSAAPGSSVFDMLTDWRLAGGVAALLLGAVVFKLRRRPTVKAPEQRAGVLASTPPASRPTLRAEQPPSAAAAVPLRYGQSQEIRAPLAGAGDAAAQWSASPHMASRTDQWESPPTTDRLLVPESGRSSARRLPGTGISREFHITQQFQPVAERLVALSTPEEIVQQARTHYMEDGDVFRAIDLLEMAVSARKDSTRPWQALFAIYRRENMPERFQRLVLTYRGTFGQDENWPAIRALGSAIDVNNPLYGGDAPATPIPEDLVERWLGVPLDFTAHLLANEMHDQLMDTYPGRKRRKRMSGE